MNLYNEVHSAKGVPESGTYNTTITHLRDPLLGLALQSGDQNNRVRRAAHSALGDGLVQLLSVAGVVPPIRAGGGTLSEVGRHCEWSAKADMRN